MSTPLPRNGTSTDVPVIEIHPAAQEQPRATDMPQSDADVARGIMREQANIAAEHHRAAGELLIWMRQFAAISQVLVGLSAGDEKVMGRIPGIAHASADGAVRRYRDLLARDFKVKEPEKTEAKPNT